MILSILIRGKYKTKNNAAIYAVINIFILVDFCSFYLTTKRHKTLINRKID